MSITLVKEDGTGLANATPFGGLASFVGLSRVLPGHYGRN